MRTWPLVLGLAALLMVFVSSCDDGEACEESSRALAAHDVPSSLGFSFADAIYGRERFSTTIQWREAPEWVGLKAKGTTVLEAQLSYDGQPVREVVATKTARLSTNDKLTCASRIESRATLMAQTADSLLAHTFAIDVAAFEPNVVRIEADLPASSFVASDVTVAWHESIDFGERVGRLIASRARLEDAGVSVSDVHTIAEWIIEEPATR